MAVAVLLNLPKPGKVSCWVGSWMGGVGRPEEMGKPEETSPADAAAVGGVGSVLLPDMRLRLHAHVTAEVLALLPPGG